MDGVIKVPKRRMSQGEVDRGDVKVQTIENKPVIYKQRTRVVRTKVRSEKTIDKA